MPNKQAHPNKQAGMEHLYNHYRKNCVQVEKFVIYYEKLLQGRFFFLSKMLSEYAHLLGRSEYHGSMCMGDFVLAVAVGTQPGFTARGVNRQLDFLSLG